MISRSYIIEVLVALDRLGNALAGGCAGQTVSGRVGWHANHGNHIILWLFPQAVINWGFSLIDGDNHCLESIEFDRTISDHTTFGLIAVTFLAVLFAVPIGILLRARALFIWCKGKLKGNFNL